MPVLAPQFEAPMGPAQGQLEAENLGQSWIQQAAQRQQIQANTQETQARTAQLQAMMPALVAKTQADTAVAAGTIASAAIQQNMRQQAGQQMPQATQDFTDAMQLADWNERADALQQVQARYSWLGQVPESKALDTAIDNARVQAHNSAITDMQLQTQRAIWGQRTAATMYGADQRLQGTLANVGARLQGIEEMGQAAGGRANEQVSALVVKEYGDAATQLEMAASKELDPQQANGLRMQAQAYRQQMLQWANKPVTPAQPATGTTPPTKSTVTAPKGGTPRVTDWQEALKLNPTTQPTYIGPDGMTYNTKRTQDAAVAAQATANAPAEPAAAPAANG